MRGAERVSIVKHGFIKYFIPTAAQLGMRSLYSRKGRKAPVPARTKSGLAPLYPPPKPRHSLHHVQIWARKSN